jgi:predicted SprT family Zn-dependent metalloprotease
MVAKKAAEFGEENVTWEIKRMRTEWGSCMTKRRHLLFNLELARLPMKCIEFIVIHELTHLQEKYHNKHFEELMDMRMPMWRSIRQDLNSIPATKYEYTPDWKGEITRIADVVNERSIVNLSMVLSFLTLCQLGEVEKEDFILSSENKNLVKRFTALCPLSQFSFDDALRLCGDTEFYRRNDSEIHIKELWVKALFEDSEFLQEVLKHCQKKLSSLVKEYQKVAAVVEPIEEFDDLDSTTPQAKYSQDKKTLIRVSTNTKTFIIPEGTRVIGSSAFAGCKDLIEVTIPNSVVRIEPGAFSGCVALEDLVVPPAVMKVGVDAFKDTGLDTDFTDAEYRDLGYYTPSVIESLPANSVMVYAGKEDKKLAEEVLKVKATHKFGLNGQSYSIPSGCSWEQYSGFIADFLSYAKDNENIRFVVRESVYEGRDLTQVSELFKDSYELDNIILPYELYQVIDEFVNRKIKIDPVAKYKYGGVINFSYVVNALQISSDPKENESLQDRISAYNQEHAKQMLLPLCKRYNTGMSIHPNAGIYIGEDDQFYDEGSFEVRIIGVKSNQLKRIAEEICSMFLQESVLVRDEVQKSIYFLYAPIINVKQHPAFKDKIS